MPKINVLPKSVAELIAAGEVVERPSSVVKELVENSIDAGAKTISVEIKNGGVRYIRVTDDGCGIHREDVRTAFISHATSKISSSEDLDSIFTLGFRGEALPSVAAVSKLSMLTKTSDEDEGTSFEIEGGEEKSFDAAGCPDGTTIIIRDLFYNTPARMKFLKKDSTEGTYVSDVVAKTAISHPDIRFSLIRDGKQVISTPGDGKLLSCIFSVFGKEVSDSLIECDYEYKSVKVKGFVSRPLNNRPNRNLQYCYVNGRFVRIPAAAAALDQAYKNRIMAGKFPVCFLFTEIPPGKIDVNVHPAKTEVRFSEDSVIFEAIYYAAKAALNKGDNKPPEVELSGKKDVLAKKMPDTVQMSFAEKNVRKDNDVPVKESASAGSEYVVRKESRIAEKEENFSKLFNEKIGTSVSEGGYFRDTSGVFQNLLSKDEVRQKNIELLRQQREKKFSTVPFSENEEKHDICDTDNSISVSTDEQTDSSVIADGNTDNKDFPVNENKSKENELSVSEDTALPVIPEYSIVGEVFATYILVENEGKLLIIDKHAAHERIIFNELKNKGFSEDSQMLLVPVSVPLSGKEYAAVIENLHVFSEGGFTVEDFGGECVIVRDCPVSLQKEDIVAVITEMAGELLRGNMRPVPEKLTWLYHSTACRRAVKAGDVMKKEETEALVRKILSDSDVRYCPHGRPVMYELSKREIEKQFGRV